MVKDNQQDWLNMPYFTTSMLSKYWGILIQIIRLKYTQKKLDWLNSGALPTTERKIVTIMSLNKSKTMWLIVGHPHPTCYTKNTLT